MTGRKGTDEAHLGQKLLQVEEALAAKFIKREDADENTYAPLSPSQATQRRAERAATRKERAKADLVFAEEERQRARERTARYRARQRGENVPKFPRGTPANPDSFHFRMKSALRPWERVNEDLKERIWAKRRQR
ncbi:hypothetical protein I307_02797 [Cryptococcus deuterogattii 99/473]|uniref:Uncharacterized protein n=1 Tax=Cryptococcus deuterogattii Ram5 TaxID=1296110 RepID=A0A0D0TSU9_9TREE|nr:hypothetical protein I309_03197 [Cryptococcus deuterogattii LA55]KIR35444.1 hypothetical protein I352_01719 [Cryptococcus deuterogattii MMRL2647]KIR38713.1 hypothetical protein I313_05351 [Cryptococcus deuterogattii Ram5]KIR70898.1 hypothetical protein I310_05310 [Cryptococcus deuterogattii CA1014]KIR90508.1 hypothetical protein I304_05650 [Cryptococcus deuterogattii CBS 10090]KIR97240.1 hypothetical protein L804_05422 [Cryptococcus deuterogattii 2001/935-1]KIY57724.1 hypothetical protein 